VDNERREKKEREREYQQESQPSVIDSGFKRLSRLQVALVKSAALSFYSYSEYIPSLSVNLL
jgi:hypothetical protein